MFSITDDQFAAEKAVMAVLYDAEAAGFIDADGVFSSDYESNGITIKAGSSVHSVSQTRALSSSGDTIEMDLVVVSDGDEINVRYEGTLDGSTLRTEAFSGRESYSVTPAAIIMSGHAEEIEALIRDYCTGSSSDDFTIYEDESLYDSASGVGWLVFSSPSIDGAKHKVNFIFSNGVISEMELDGWCESVENNLSVDTYPGIKSDDAKLSDEEAFNLARAVYSLILYYQGNLVKEDPDAVNCVEWVGNNYFFTDYPVYILYDHPVIVNGSIIQGDNMDFSLDIGEHHLESRMDSTFDYIEIDGVSYSHLRDLAYQNYIQITILHYQLRGLFTTIINELYGNAYYTKGNIDVKKMGDGCIEYSFEDFEWSGYDSAVTDGVLRICGDSFSFDICFSGVKNDGLERTVEVEGNGYFTDVKCPQFNSLAMNNLAGGIPANEIRFYNKLFTYDTWIRPDLQKPDTKR